MTPPTTATSWRCPRCDADRAGADTFCGRCGARRPRQEASADQARSIAGLPLGVETTPPEDRPRSFPVRRALILNGVILGAVLLAVIFGRGGGPTAIAFEPPTWRCDGLERTWVATIPAAHSDLRIDWRIGGPVGDARATETITRLALEPYLTSDGSFHVFTSDPDAPECGLDPGPYTMTIRDASSGALVASGDVTLEPRP